LSDLKEAGVILLESRQIVILDEKELRDIQI